MTTIKRVALGLLAGAVLATSAHAGGFSRGSANLDGLYASEYRDQPIISSLGVTFVSPGRSYDSVTVRNPAFNPLAPVGGTNVPFLPGGAGFDFSEDFVVPFASLGLQFGDRGRCVGSYSQPYGADSTNSGPVTFYQLGQSIETFELGLTCSAGFDIGRGRAYAIGGVFYEGLEYNQSRNFLAIPAVGTALGATTTSSIDVSSEDIGYRLGAAYEISEIALKAQVLYRSETTHNVSGTFSNTPFAGIFGSRALRLQGQAVALGNQATAAAAAGNLTLAAQLQAQALEVGRQAAQQGAFSAAAGATQTASAFGSATLPRQLELNVQSGIAPGTLAFGSIKWTDWSVVQRVDLFDSISNQPFTDFTGNFRDGYTVTLGVGRAFNDDLAGSLSVTWDRGVGTGFDTFSDTYTVAAGAAYDLNEIATIRGGGAVIYFTDGEKTQGDFLATSPDEFGYALSTSLNIKF